VLFYRGLLLAVLVTAFTIGVLLAAAGRFNIPLATVIGAALTQLSFNVCFLVLFPVTIDRSISVFLLSRIEQQQQPLTTDDLKAIFQDEYVGSMQQIPRRVYEQQISGNIAVDHEGRIVLTPQGLRFNHLARIASRWFYTDPRFVGDQGAQGRK
jgi:hypothetical protein